MTIAAFLIAMVGPLLARIIAALGVSLVTMAGLEVATATLKSTMIGALGSIPLDGLELAGLYGVWTCIGLALGAITFVLTWESTKGFMAVVKT